VCAITLVRYEKAVRPCLELGAQLLEVGVRHDLGADEPALEVPVDRAGRPGVRPGIKRKHRS